MTNSATIWLINATQDLSSLSELCRQAQKSKQLVHILHKAADADAVKSVVDLSNEYARSIELADSSFDFPPLPDEDAAEILFLPCVGDIDWASLQQGMPLNHVDSLQPIVTAPAAVDPVVYQIATVRWFGWRAQAKLARRILREPTAWKPGGLDLVEALQRWDSPPRWHSIAIPIAANQVPPPVKTAMTMESRVLIVISFFKCEEWLHACLASMTCQTRPPENIVVIDDCSPAVPVGIVERFPNVTLLSTTRNIGPEKILNNIIRATDYDAYLVQDPDDWSSCDRLELSLRYAEETGADLVGTHEFTIHHPHFSLQTCTFPPDVNHAMLEGAPHCLLHCTGLFSRALVRRLGGFDENLKLAADTDFIVRAWHAGRIVNLPHFCVFHRIRTGSLTTHSDTGYKSAARTIEAKFIIIRSRRNLEAVRAGRPPTFVVQQKIPVGFVHRLGPKLRLSSEKDEYALSTIADV
jgi:hypothetical protein